MDVKLEVLLSSCIKNKKPWPRFCWLGREEEAVFLLDDSHISEIDLVSGQIGKKLPKLQPLLPKLVTMSASPSGLWLVGLLDSGEVFLWNKDRDLLKMVPSVPELQELVSCIKAQSVPQLSLLVSEDMQRVFLAARTGQVFLWQCQASDDQQDGFVQGSWSQILHPPDTPLPPSRNKEALVHSLFVKNQVIGDLCLSAFVFCSGGCLTVTFLKLQWDETWSSNISSAGFGVLWVSRSFQLDLLRPPCRPEKSRGSLLAAFSPDARLLSVVLNQRDPQANQVMFISTQNFVSVCSLLGGCGLKTRNIPEKYVRSYWVSSVGWTADGLYLACVLKRGSLLMLARLGGLVLLSTSGCSVDFDAAHFLPLHPLVTYRPPFKAQDADLSSSSASRRDVMRQRFSVTCHPLQPFLLVSDGYMVTMLSIPQQPSATAIMTDQLLAVAEGLERVRKVMGSSQPQLRSRLESMSTLMLATSLLSLREKENPLSTLPRYLQDPGGRGNAPHGTKRRQAEDDDLYEAPYILSNLGDEGKLNFASMFDTLHAQVLSSSEPHAGSRLQEDINQLQRSLIRSWALAVSLGGSLEQRESVFGCTILCVSRLVNLIRISSSAPRRRKKPWVTRVLQIFSSLLAFLPWDATRARGHSCLGFAVELVRRFVDIFLPLSASDEALSSHNFSTVLWMLQEASECINQTFSLPPTALPPGKDGQLLCPADTFTVPLFQEHSGKDLLVTQQQQQPANRLVGIWRQVYRRAVQYQTHLHTQYGEDVESELVKMSHVVPQVQRALQEMGEGLDERHALRDFTGEEHFIVGEYPEAVQVWESQLCAEEGRGHMTVDGSHDRLASGGLACVQRTRCYLALLYERLYHYQLRDAQGLCDRLSRELQTRPGRQDVDQSAGVEDPGGPVGRQVVCAVIQSMGRFMVAYFTNQPLHILPPHSVDVLPALHLPHRSGVRVVELSRAGVAAAVRSQQLSAVWTVDYALELLLLGGLLPEAVWMARRLGDWKMAATLGLAYTTYCSGHLELKRLAWRDLHLPVELHPAQIFQSQLEMLLGRVMGADANDLDLLQLDVQEILKASAMAEVDIISQPLSRLMEAAKEQAASLPALLPAGFYLPAPPLYCPQPSPSSHDSVKDSTVVREGELRQQVSVLIKKVLVLLRASCCCHAAAQWYIKNLRFCRHLLYKIRNNVSQHIPDFIPDRLKVFSTHPGYFHSGSRRDLEEVTTKSIICFRELCALCWMLHVRDQLSVSCRRVQTARKQHNHTQMTDLCSEALRWCGRLMPFCRFLNAEEVLQDLVLSLLSELPPSHVTAETLVTVFPEEAESVRVSLRDKHQLLMNRLITMNLLDDTATGDQKEGENMMVVIQDRLRQRRRELRLLQKYLSTPETFIWEREEEEERPGAASLLKRLSLGASLSDSTLTDAGRPLVSSEGDTAETPEPESKTSRGAEQHQHPHPSGGVSKAKEGPSVKPTSSVKKGQGLGRPSVGTWEFELEDEKYTLFLDLFLSYVLGQDGPEAEEAEVPLLSTFSPQLHTRELHSVSFDMLTGLKQRQTAWKRRQHCPLFRAGHCFQTLPSSPDLLQSSGPVPSETSGLRVGKPLGLFGARREAKASSDGELIPIGSRVQSPAYRVLSQTEVDVQTTLDPVLERRFPHLARLLEWMMRWANRRTRLSQPIRKKREDPSQSVIIRVKATTSAVLYALELLGHRYADPPKPTSKTDAFSRPVEQKLRPAAREGEESDAPASRPISGWKRERESSVDTGYPASAGTPMTLQDLEPQPSPDVCVEEEDGGDAAAAVLRHSSTTTSTPRVHVSRPAQIYVSKPFPDADHSTSSTMSESSWSNPSRDAPDQMLSRADLESVESVEPEERSPSPTESPSLPVIPQQPEGPSADVQTQTYPDGPAPPQDELFKLLQMQQMNFSSVLRVVETSFSHLSHSMLPQSSTPLPQAESAPAPAPAASQSSSVPVRHGSEMKATGTSQLPTRYDPPDAHTESRSFIPPSQVLLSAAPTSSLLPPAVSFEAARDPAPHLRAATSTYTLKLLQLNPSPPVYLRTPPPPVHLPVRQAWGSVQHFLPSVFEHRGQAWTGPSLWPGADQPYRSTPAPSLPLLDLQPVPPPHVPQFNTAKPDRLGITSTNCCYRIQLLRLDPENPVSGCSVRTPRLIPLEELMQLTVGRQSSVQKKLQPDHILLGKHKTQSSSKMHKRKKEKKQEKKAVVTFKPKVSIISTEEVVQPAEDVAVQEDELIIPSGPSDVELSGQRLLDRAYTTSAELHLFASSQKTPPVLQDACSNTEPEPSPCLADKAVSVQLPSPRRSSSACTLVPVQAEEKVVDITPVRVPDFFNLQDVSQEPTRAAVSQIPERRRFISVTDLTGDTLPQSPPPSSAQLHFLAASVVNPTPDPTPVTVPSLPQHSSSDLTDPLPALVPEARPCGDPVTLSVLSGVSGAERARMSGTQISARLSEMDSQLLRLQQIADQIDQHITATGLPLNTAVMARSSVTSGEEHESLRVLRRVRSTAAAAHTHIEDTPQRYACSPPGSLLRQRTPPPVKAEQLLRDTDRGEKRRGTRHSCSAVSLESLLEEPEELTEDLLNLSGLSDVKDILCEVLGAAGGSGPSPPSPSGLAPAEVKPSGVMMEDDRKDLRMWMRRKHRERQKEYCQQRDEKRKTELRPFVSPVKQGLTSVDLMRRNREREERERLAYMEHHEQRTREACSLMADLLDAPLGPAAGAPRTPRSQMSRARPASSSEKSSPRSIPDLHRPVSALPGGPPSPLHAVPSTSSASAKQRVARTTDQAEMEEEDEYEDLLQDLEGLSEGSVLNKLNWAAIERLVAGEKDDQPPR